jgi:hypothetical protein
MRGLLYVARETESGKGEVKSVLVDTDSFYSLPSTPLSLSLPASSSPSTLAASISTTATMLPPPPSPPLRALLLIDGNSVLVRPPPLSPLSSLTVPSHSRSTSSTVHKVER